MSKLFPTTKDTNVGILGYDSTDVLPLVSVAGNYISLLSYSNNVKQANSYANSSTPLYGSGDATASGYPSFTLGGDLFVYIEAQTVTTVTVTAPGSGYTSAPAVVFTGGGGTGATGIALLNTSGGVSKVWVTNGGSGYTSAPTMSFTGGAGTGATATAAINQYIDAQFDRIFACSNLAIRNSPFGLTASSKAPYWYGSVSMTGLTYDFPSSGIMKISFASKGNGTITRGEW